MNCETTHFSPRRRRAPRMQRPPIGHAVLERVDEEQAFATPTLVRDSERDEFGPAAVVVVVQVQQEGHDPFALRRNLLLVVRRQRIDEVEMLRALLAGGVVQDRQRLQLPECHAGVGADVHLHQHAYEIGVRDVELRPGVGPGRAHGFLFRRCIVDGCANQPPAATLDEPPAHLRRDEARKVPNQRGFMQRHAGRRLQMPTIQVDRPRQPPPQCRIAATRCQFPVGGQYSQLPLRSQGPPLGREHDRGHRGGPALRQMHADRRQHRNLGRCLGSAEVGPLDDELGASVGQMRRVVRGEQPFAEPCHRLDIALRSRFGEQLERSLVIPLQIELRGFGDLGRRFEHRAKSARGSVMRAF